MTRSNQYQEFLRSKISSAVSDALAASTLTHSGVKGLVLEILISQLFRPLLPADIGIGTGQIIEQHRGILSNQIDIILYDKSILPPALYDSNVGIFPIEAVLYTIEVKTRLDARGLAEAHESAKKIHHFRYLPGLVDAQDRLEHHTIEQVRSVIFALSSTCKKEREADRYSKMHSPLKDPPFIRAICVANGDYCYDNGESWVTFLAENNFDGVLAFIGGVMNSYRKVARSRNYPLLGHYIIPNNSLVLGPATHQTPKISIKCENCEFETEFKADFGNKNIIVDGKIAHKEPCPKCGGKLTSIERKWRFINGVLQE